MPDQDTLVKALQCVLFAAKEPVSIPDLAEVLQVDVTQMPGLIAALDSMFEGTGLQTVRLAGGYSLATRPEFADYVRRLLQPDPQRLSIQALETLTIIAYRQPVTRPEIDEIRGVNSSGAVMSLIEKDLARIAGRKNAAGRPFLLETTARFLSAFGLAHLDDLPDIGRLREVMDRASAAGELLDFSATDADSEDLQPDDASGSDETSIASIGSGEGGEMQSPPSPPEADASDA